MKRKRNRFYLALTFFTLALIVPVFCFLCPPSLFMASARLGGEFVLAEDLPEGLQEEFLSEEPALPEVPTLPGRVEGTGTSFEIKDSDYLNVKLTSSEEIKIMLESVPRMVSLNIEPINQNLNSTILTLEGLEPNKTYYKYEDSYKNGVEIISDENSVFIWTQDLSQSHHVWFQEEKGTIFLPDQCSTYGSWDAATSTCTLMQDLTESVEIAADDVTLDCANHRISGTGSGYGTFLNGREGVVIEGCSITGFTYAIFLTSSSRSILSENSIISNLFGMWLDDSPNNTLVRNVVSGNRLGIVSFDPHNNVITGNTVTLNGEGMLLWGNDRWFRTYDTITDNIISDNHGIGVHIDNAGAITIAGNRIEANGQGVHIWASNYITLANNRVLDNYYGIWVLASESNAIVDNDILSNTQGIRLQYGASGVGSIVFGNSIAGNGYGIYILTSSNNKVFHNNLMSNENQLYAEGSGNLFDDGYPSGGNYWSNYSGVDLKKGPNQDQLGNDGIGDTSYIFTGGQDRYPFMKESGWEVLPPPNDTTPSETEIIAGPSETIDYNDVTFSWIGSDDITPTSELVYSYYLQGYDSDWSDWTFDTSKSYYGLPDGDYTFKVKAKDKAGNIDPTPAERSFTVSIPWSFAIITDLHIGWGIPDYNGESYNDSGVGQEYFVTERLRKAVQKINENYKNPEYNIKFVVVLGDISDTGEYSEFLKAREILNELEIPYVPIIGNHDIWPYIQKINVNPDGWGTWLARNRGWSLKVGAQEGDSLGDEYFEIVFWKDNPENLQKVNNLFSNFERQEELSEYEGAHYFHNYSFDYIGTKFVSLDFASRDYTDLIRLPGTSSVINAETISKFEDRLKNCIEEKLVVFVHFPFSYWGANGDFDPLEYDKLKNLIDHYGEINQCKVDVFAGHMHIDYFRDLGGNNFSLITEALMQSDIENLASFDKAVRIVTIDNENSSLSYDKFIKIFPEGVGAINPYFTSNLGEISANQEFVLSANTKNLKPEEIFAYNWDFDRNYSAECITPDGEFPKCTITYNQSGSYKISLKVTPKSDPTYSEEISWTLDVKEERKNPFKIFLPIPGLIPLLNGEEGANLTLQENAQNTTEWAVITKVTSPAKLIGALNIHFEQAIEDVDFSNIVADIDLQERKSIFYMTSWPELIEEEKILFVPSTGAGSIYICPNATSLEEINPLCNDIVVLGTGEEKNGIIVTTIIYNGQEYYFVLGIKGTGGGEFGVIEKTIKELNDYIQGLSDTSFTNNPLQRKNALEGKLEEVFIKIENKEYQDAINKLQKDIWAKFDGDLATTTKDWIISAEAILELSIKMNEFIAYFQGFL